MAEVREVRNLRALTTPPMQKLLEDTIASNDWFAPLGLNSIVQELAEFVTRPDHFMLVGAEKGELRGLILLRLPQDYMFPYPHVVMGYQKGSRELHRAMMDRTLDIVLEAGYTSLWSHNTSGHSDAALARSLRSSRGELSTVGSLMELKIK